MSDIWTAIAHLFGTDHRPSTCCIAYGQHLAGWLAHDVCGAPEPAPFQCPCACRRCRAGKCPTVAEGELEVLLVQQRQRTAPGRR